jgi:hypothetical protein
MSDKPDRRNPAIFRQICELIPSHLTAKIARKHNIQHRSIRPWDHWVSLLYAQFTRALGLNDVCDALRANTSLLASVRGAKPPSRNGLSHANRTRSPEMFKELFWTVLSHLQTDVPGFGGPSFAQLPRRFRRAIHILDSTTIKLVGNCMDWAKHRRRKAAAKLHLRLDLKTFLPAFAVVESAKGHDNTKAHELCAGLQAGEIVVFDMAYIDFGHLCLLTNRGVFWVSRVKENMQLLCVKRLLKKPKGRILRDDIVLIKSKTKRKNYPERMRRVTALVEIEGEEVEMTFFSNNFSWSAQSLCDLYKARWHIERFFRQLKQTVHINSFLGHNRNAIESQVWMALLTYVLLRYLYLQSSWGHSFTRLYTCLRAVLWQRRELYAYLKSYGTADGSFTRLYVKKQGFLPGFG